MKCDNYANQSWFLAKSSSLAQIVPKGGLNLCKNHLAYTQINAVAFSC